MPPSPAYLLTFGAITTLGLLALLLAGQRILAPAHTVAGDLARGNTARALLQVGEVLAVFLVAASTVASCVTGESVQRDALWTAAFGVAALVLVAAAGRLGVRFLLRSRLPAEIERGNVAAGLAAGASYVATGIVTARVLAGNDLRSLGLSLTFFVVAVTTLQILVAAFRALTPYDDAEQIQGENLAAALSYAGVSISVALIVGHAAEGDFVSWGVSLAAYGESLLLCLALYPVRQIVVQSLFLGGGLSLRRGRLDEAIGAQRNAGAAALEAVSYVATALLVTRLG